MKRASEPNKIYYDVTIDHNPSQRELCYNFASKAVTTIDLREPLIESPGDYNLSITKFKIDTETVPIMIPELQQPQKYTDLMKNNFKTIYAVNIKIDFYRTEDKTETHTVEVYAHINKRKNKEGVSPQIIGDLFNVKKDKKGKITEADVYINNVDEQCFIYDYSDLIQGMNTAIANVLQAIKSKQFTDKYKVNFKISEDYTANVPFKFTLEGDRLVFWIYDKFFSFQTMAKYTISSAQISFSPELYKYFGNGFRTTFLENGWWTINRLYYHPYLDKTTKYYKITQSYCTLPNWHCMKALIIGSDNLPVVEEYLPISHKNGFLTHYKTKDYEDILRKLGYDINNDERDVFKKNTQRILEIYYPFTSVPGDVRSSVIFSSENPGAGQNVELSAASPIQKINIWIKWLDTYGNIHDLYLYPGCAADIRMCFIKKTIYKEDIAEGFEAVIECLPEKKNKGPTESNGRPDGIVLDGADNFGFIHL